MKYCYLNFLMYDNICKNGKRSSLWNECWWIKNTVYFRNKWGRNFFSVVKHVKENLTKILKNMDIDKYCNCYNICFPFLTTYFYNAPWFLMRCSKSNNIIWYIIFNNHYNCSTYFDKCGYGSRKRNYTNWSKKV